MAQTKITLLLLPGLDGSGVMFRPLLRHLPSHFNPVVVTYPRNQPLGYNQLLPIVMAAIPGNSTIVLLGESFSGPLALMAASRCPAGLRVLILSPASYVVRYVLAAAGWAQSCIPRCFARFQQF